MMKRVQSRAKDAQASGPKTVDEPMGIVISSGSQGDDAPRFSAYVWGPVPEADVDAELIAVA
jgi:hypothetical protein